MSECLKCQSTDLEQKNLLKPPKYDANAKQQFYICQTCGFTIAIEAMAFVKRIHQIRVTLDLTFHELANHLNIDIAIVCNWKQGRANQPGKLLMSKIEQMEQQIKETGTAEVYKSKNRQGPRFLPEEKHLK